MQKEYKPNEYLKFRLILTSYKKHPFWKKRALVRWILIGIGVFAAIANTVYFYQGSKSFSLSLLGTLSGGLLGGLPYLVYWAALRDTCSEGIRSKTKETLTLTDDGIVNLYLPARAKRYYNYQEDIFKYSKIQKIEYYESSRKVYIYGNYLNRYYADYFSKDIGNERGIKGDKITLFMYYEDSDDFLKTLSVKCNKEIINML